MKKKSTKSFAGLALAGLLSMGMVIPGFAMETTINMANQGADGAEYSAYQLLDLTTSPKSESNELNYNYTINNKYESILKNIVGEQDGDDRFTVNDILAYLQPGGVNADDDAVRKFADDVYRAIVSGGVAADATDTGGSFSVDQGYYLIVETKKGASPDSYSLVMLDTADRSVVNVTTKESVPSMTKTLVDGEQEYVGDRGLGDSAEFELKGTMPDNIGSYDTYKYYFHDALSEGLTLDVDSFIVKIDGQVISSDNYFLILDTNNHCSFEIGFNDIKAVAAISETTVVTVNYKVTLNSDAVAGKAETNTAYLEFSNNPYVEGDTDNTPSEQDRLYTYKLIVNKVDEEDIPLAGANFELEMKIGNEYKSIRTLDIVDGQTEFVFDHLDAGDYRLVETKTPDGYAAIDPIEFTISSEFENEAVGAKTMVLKLLSVTSENDGFTAVTETGTVSTKVINVTGSKLPSTGGSGTYALYGVGGVMLVGGLILVISHRKKESSAKES